MTTEIAETRPVWGLAAFIFGVIALVAVTLSISDVFVDEEQASAAATIGEIAAEIRQSAQRALAGEEAPPPQPAPDRMDVQYALLFITPVLAAIAAILGAIGLFRREPVALPTIGIGLGIGAFVMQFAFWLALVIGGICLLVAIINNIDGIIGG